MRQNFISYTTRIPKIEARQMYPTKQRQRLLFTLSSVMTGAILLAGMGVYTALNGLQPRMGTVDNSSQDTLVVEADTSQLPIDTSISSTGTDISVPELEASRAAPPVTKQQNEPGKNLGGVNWQGKNLQGMKLQNAHLGGANLQNADLTNVDLSGAILAGANLANSNLSGVNLSNANLSGANLDNANLTNANLSSADLRGANLDDANLEGARLNGTLLDGANLSGATLP
ncbi:pentapeptide repeat-containing protein [Scytonema sp. UIC 10036]|uniref:pentapeptide repeat-containing protein n=1 Tax=Scytonema sp. UIC 10036 TaxID=2304196 RepID=UPI001FAA61D5|nr:pentapeptide repeat-containing protein [Scytonema sp. UIC 10036]